MSVCLSVCLCIGVCMCYIVNQMCIRLMIEIGNDRPYLQTYHDKIDPKRGPLCIPHAEEREMAKPVQARLGSQTNFPL